MLKRFIIIFGLFLGLISPVFANITCFDGSELSLLWIIPFAGLLLSLALLPMLIPNWWHHHMGKISLFWGSLAVLSLMVRFGLEETGIEILKVIFHEYIPFVVFIGALYTIGGGIYISVIGRVSPATNVLMLSGGTLLASLIGTTGAAMLFIRPILKLNQFRIYRQHVVIFFIFLVANIGGSLTPLGDPPLFLGFLNGVSFFWPALNLWTPFLMVSVPLLLIFWLIDHYCFYHDPHVPDPEHFHDKAKVYVKGKRNIILLISAAGVVLLSGFLSSPFHVKLCGIEFQLTNLIRDIVLFGLAVLSHKITPQTIYQDNEYSWGPLQEVAKLFLGIFITMIPVTAILTAGTAGSMAKIFHFANPGGSPFEFYYYWMTGLLSAFLDNAPTYLVFFHMAGGDANILMNQLGLTLTAISGGAVFMGAMTYIGNAPNFMVRSLAVHAGIKMPGFFGYMAWSFGILLPIFFVMSWTCFWH